MVCHKREVLAPELVSLALQVLHDPAARPAIPGRAQAPDLRQRDGALDELRQVRLGVALDRAALENLQRLLDGFDLLEAGHLILLELRGLRDARGGGVAER